MNESTTKYIVSDTSNESFWVKTVHYGFSADNKQVFDARFSNNLLFASFSDSELMAQSVINNFKNPNFNYINLPNLNSLKVVKVKITYSIENE